MKGKGNLTNKRQNRVGLVMGIFAIILSIAGGFFGLLFNYLSILPIPIGSFWFIVSYLLIAIIINCIVLIVIYIGRFLYQELRVNDVNNVLRNGVIRSDKCYEDFIKSVEVVAVLFAFVFFALAWSYLIGTTKNGCFLIILAIICIIIIIIIKKRRNLGYIKTNRIYLRLFFVVVPMSMVIAAGLLFSNFDFNSNFNVVFSSDGIVKISRERTDNDVIVKIDFCLEGGDEIIPWSKKITDKDWLEGYSGLFAESSIEPTTAILPKQNRYSSFEIDLNEVMEKELNMKVKDGEAKRIRGKITIEGETKKIYISNQFVKNNNKKYSFAKNKINVDYVEKFIDELYKQFNLILRYKS